jgi:NADH-quinone oxidoreductase subunit I
MWNYLKEIGLGFYSLLVGMWITLRHLFRRPVTVQYPYQTVRLPARYRGHIELTCDESTKQPKCIVCMACQRACPSGCITLDGQKPEGGTRKVLTQYKLNFTTCSLCGLCVESCNFAALRFSRDYNLASTRKEDYIMDLLAVKQEKS